MCCRDHLRLAVRSGWPTWVPPVGVDPARDVDGIEPQQVSPLDVGNAALVNETADVADVDTKGVGDLDDGQQPAK